MEREFNRRLMLTRDGEIGPYVDFDSQRNFATRDI